MMGNNPESHVCHYLTSVLFHQILIFWEARKLSKDFHPTGYTDYETFWILQIWLQTNEILRKELCLWKTLLSSNFHGTDNIMLHILDFIYAPSVADFFLDIRLHVEFRWIHILHTIALPGLNIKDMTPKANYGRDIESCVRKYIIEVKMNYITRCNENRPSSRPTCEGNHNVHIILFI